MTLKTTRWDPVDFLKNDAEIRSYLKTMIATEDPDMLDRALEVAARARARIRAADVAKMKRRQKV